MYWPKQDAGQSTFYVLGYTTYDAIGVIEPVNGNFNSKRILMYKINHI